MGEIFAFCQSNGSSPVFRSFWEICCNSGTACYANVFKIVGVKLSAPGTFCGILFFQKFHNSLSSDFDW